MNNYYSVEYRKGEARKITKCSRAKAVEMSTGCQDNAGGQTGAYRATCSSSKFSELIKAGGLHFDINNIARCGDIEIECIG